MTMRDTIDAVVKVLGPQIGDTMARSAPEAHCQKLGIEPGSPLTPDQLGALLGKLGGGLNIFLGRDKARVLDRILTVAYPALDLVLLIPLVLLLSGFVFLCAGDICFAYFQSLGEEHLDPFVHATFILSYALIAGGAQRQLSILKS